MLSVKLDWQRLKLEQNGAICYNVLFFGLDISDGGQVWVSGQYLGQFFIDILFSLRFFLLRNGKLSGGY